MSILIKGERIPNNCMDCKMASIDKWYECPFYAIMKEDYSDKRFENCPLVEVITPHGRLIDADNGIDEDVKDYEFNGKYAGCTIQDMLDCAPTVIEAEGEE